MVDRGKNEMLKIPGIYRLFNYVISVFIWGDYL